MRRQGIKSIERLSSAIWTDYNLSDPGITILEAVCYAITDLAYRSSYQIKDLLAPKEDTKDAWKQIFYTARQILHNSPLTLVDYRKLILDVPGVRNAWIAPSKDYEVPIWIDYTKAERREEEGCHCDDADDKLCMGKLSLYPWNDRNSNEALIKSMQEEAAKLQAEANKLELVLKSGTDPIEVARAKEQLVQLRKKAASLQSKIAALQKQPTEIPSKIVELEGLLNVTVEYEEDVLEEDQREEVRQLIIERLQGHRNLCEDILSVNAVEYEDFGIGASIALEEAADPDEVLARIFFVIYRYFTPSIPFYTIDQLLQKGRSVEDIFEGPALRNGFLDTDDLEATDLFRDIRLSDIISEISDLPGVKAVLFLRLPFRGFDEPTDVKEFFNEWVAYLTEERKIARIQPDLSSVMFCKEQEFITYNVNPASDRKPDRMKKLFYDKKVMERKYRLKGTPLDFPVPEGENMELQDFYPVTYTLPECYGVSDRAGLPEGASPTQVAQAMQLKGYLLFFEQILSDYVVQLDNLRSLFSFDDSVKATQHTRVLGEMEGLHRLLADHSHSNHHGEQHEQQLLADFKEVLENLTETPEQFVVRRNAFLNHMLARFGEDLSEYEDIMYGLFPHKAGERLLNDKIRILKNGEYFQISTDRAQGFNYTKLDTWNTSNVSGAERRISRLLGFGRADRHSLAPENILIEPWQLSGEKGAVAKKDVGKKYNRIRLMDTENTERSLLTSVRVKDGCCTEELVLSILEHASERKYFVFHDERKPLSRKTAGVIGNFWFELFDDTDPERAVLLAASDKYGSKEERDNAFRRLQKVIREMDDNEGLHLLEHILLRPRMDQILDIGGNPIEVGLLNICLDDCDLNKGLGEGTEVPPYRKKISRIPAEKCYDNQPWVLEYLRMKPLSTGNANRSILFAETFTEPDKEPLPLKFRKYEALTKHVRTLQEYGAERANYEIRRNEDEEDLTKQRYSFLIHGDQGVVLAQSPYIFNRQTRAQREAGTPVVDDIELEIEALIRYFGFELDLYCGENPCDHNEDPYSFRATAVLPCWPKRFRNPSFRHLVEKTIQSESPAHVHVKVHWVGMSEMRRFEEAYGNWLTEMAQTEAPAYDSVNPLVSVLNTIKPCGHCEDDCQEPIDSGRRIEIRETEGQADGKP